MTKKRRLAAIMFTDISGFSAMMQEDESYARQILERHRKVVDTTHQRFDGELLQFFGDGTLSIFDSAVSAVECAVEMQIDLRKEPEVPLRIGIHTGDISYDENGAFGDGVNVASRVENLCERGAVYMTAKVYDDIKNHPWLKAVNLGSFNLRNIQAPMVIYAVSSKGLPVPSGRSIASKANADKKPAKATRVAPLQEREINLADHEQDLVPPLGLKQKRTAVLLAFFLGFFGAHKFYLGKRFAGISYFTLFVLSIVATVEEGFPFVAVYCTAIIVQAILLAVMPKPEFDAKYNSGAIVRKRIVEKRKEKKAPRKDPIENLLERGLRKFRSKKYVQAINYFDHILDFDRNNSEAHYYLACCFSKTRQKDQALYHLNEALSAGFVNERDVIKEPTLRFVRNLPEYKGRIQSDVVASEASEPKALPEPKPDLLSDDRPFDPLVLEKIEVLGEKLGKGELTQQEFQLEKEKILRGE